MPPGMSMPPGMGGPMLGSAPPMMMQKPPGTMPNMPGMMPPGMRPSTPAQQTGDKTAKQPSANQTDDNLVEVTIYAISTLYRRPDPPKNAEQAPAPANPPANQPAGKQSATPPPPVGDKR